MKTRLISIIAFLLFLGVAIPDANAQFWKTLLKGAKEVGKAVAGVAVGYVSNEIENSLPEESREGWRNISSSISSDFGLDNSYVSAGSNWQQGKKNDAILDMAEGVAVSTGTSGTFVASTILDLGRAQNNYNNNIKSGMSIEEATAIRNEEWRQYAERVYDDYMVSDKTRDEIYRYNEMKYTKELREQDRALRNEIWHELLRRGYSRSEAGMYLTIIDENPGMLSGMYSESDNSIYMTGIMLTEDTSIQNTIARRASEALDNLNIIDRSEGYRDDGIQSNEDTFFGTNLVPPSPSVPAEPDADPPTTVTLVTPAPPVEPVDPSAGAKARLREIAPDRYLLNHVGLNKNQKETLDEVVSLMNQYPNIRICLNGNTCDLGTDYINELIATKRANHAKDYLVKQGVDAARIEIGSKASSEPVAEGQTGEDRMRNRRVSISILED